MTVLDRAILAYRENPTEANRAEVLRLQTIHARDFFAAQAADACLREVGGRREPRKEGGLMKR